MNNYPPEKISKEEILARYLARCLYVNGRVMPGAFHLRVFRDGTREEYVSVDRASYRLPTRDYLPASLKKKGAAGYASLRAGEVAAMESHGVGIEIKAEASEANPYHAGIFYRDIQEGTLIIGESADAGYLELSVALADMCEFHVFGDER